MKSSIFVCLILCLSNVAYAGLFDSVVSQVQQAAQTAQQQAAQKQPSQQAAEPQQQQAAAQSQQSVQQPGASDASQSIADLDKGVYGIPFKADLATVLKWAADNKVNIQNSTKEQVEDNVREMLHKIRDIKNDYEDRKASLSDAEKDVAAITTDPSIDAMEKMAAAQAQKMLETLNNPSVDYGGKTYILENKAPDGIQVEGIDKPCMDKRITDSLYSLTVSPSDQSQSLLNQSLSSIEIYFFKDESGVFSSYSSVATFANDSGDEIQKQYGMLTQVLTQKYGNPAIPDKGDADVQTIQWRKNISMQGDIRVASDTHLLSLFSNSFTVYYFEPDILDKLTALRAKAVEDFKNAQANADANKAKTMQNNF